MKFDFYDVKTRQMVCVLECDVKKIVYKRRLKTGRIQLRYALRAWHEDRWLTKFCTKSLFDRLQVPLLQSV